MLARNRTLASVLILSFLACADGAPSPSAPDAFPVAYGKGGVPGGPGGGGGGGDGGGGTGTTAQLEDGLVADAQAVSVTKDNKVALAIASGSYTLSSALDATQALAIEDQDAMTACLWEIPAGAEGLKADLVAALDAAASSRSLDAQVDKRAADRGVESSDNYINVRADEMDASPVIFLGRNNAGTGNFLVFTFTGSNIHDASSPRVFTGTGGTVRVVKRFDADGDGVAESDEPIASVRCPNLDTVVLTVAPGA